MIDWRQPVKGLVFVLLCVCTAAHALQITDDRGTDITFGQAPQRIVSMLPSLTESICALGQCQRLVGVDRYSNHPQSVGSLPKLGGGLDPNIEGIAALKPDVVLVAGKSRATDKLESLGIKVVVLEPKTHADVRRVLEVLAGLLALPDGQGAQVWRLIDRSVSAVARALPATAKTARVYVEVGSGPYAASEASFIGETLSRLGVENIVPARLGLFPRLNPEYVVRANPDVIMMGSSIGNPGALAYPGWASIKAVRNQRVCVFNRGEADVLMRPGPRMAEAARLMARCLEKGA